MVDSQEWFPGYRQRPRLFDPGKTRAPAHGVTECTAQCFNPLIPTLGRGFGRCDPQYVLYGRNLPDSTTFTRSPFGSAWRSMSMLKSIALMMPSPNSSWISSLMVVP